MMDKKFDKYEIQVEAPSSILIIGPKKNCEVYTTALIDALKPDWSDIKIVKSEDSKGKSDIVSIEQVREAQNFINLTPVGKTKLLIFENAAALMGPAANALLKTLEEPPRYAVLLLISETDNLMPTIISRCQQVKLWDGDNRKQESFNFDMMLDEPFYAQSQMLELIIQDQRASIFLNAFESWARERLLERRTIRETRLIKEIIRAKRDIKHNVSSKVVLESLILRYKHNV